ncbi:MAG: polyphenol oxidase family protein [Dermatophilaceae bacterium]
MSEASTWWWSEQGQGAVLAITSRGSGESSGRYAGLDLALHVGDDDLAVRRNRKTVVGELARLAGLPPEGVTPVFMDQVHGADVRLVTREDDLNSAVPSSDAVVTTLPRVALFALVADCTPVLLVDPDAGVAAAVHAGRPGMLAGVVPTAVTAMRDVGAREIRAVVGPSVCGRCYEVPGEMRDEAARIEPVCAAVTWTGTTAIDVAAGVVEQLARADVPTRWVPGCTRESLDLYSYRRDGRTGRFAGVVMLTGPSQDAS